MSKEFKFVHPLTLLSKCEQLISQIGAEKFMSGAGEEIKKAKESFFAFFFILGLQKITGRDWWLYQPEEFPDFNLISLGDKNINQIQIAEFELLTIPDRFTMFEEVLNSVNNKIIKYGGVKPKLLIFLNHASSEFWVKKLIQEEKNYEPFIEVWTSYLIYNSGQVSVHSVCVNKIWPMPITGTHANLSDSNTFKPRDLPPFVNIIEKNGEKIVMIKEDAKIKMRKAVARYKKNFKTP